MRTVYPVLICICLFGAFCGEAAAIPGDPSARAEEQGKAHVILEYLRIFQKALQSSHGDVLSSDAAPYDKNALEKATAEHDRQIALCKSQKEEMKTEAAYVACLIAAKRGLASAISLKDAGLIDATAWTLTQVADDTDAGRLTKDQARDVYEELDGIYRQFFTHLSEFYDDQLAARLAADYKDRFTKSYERLGPTASPADGRPPLDDDVVDSATDILTTARETCESSAQSLQKKSYVDCILAAEKQFADAVKLRDRGLYETFEAALRAALADIDSKRLTPAQFDTVAAWLSDAYSERINQQQSEYHNLAARPVVQGYVIRFAAAYVAVAGDRLNDNVMPYDASAMDQAVLDQRAAAAKCRAGYSATASEVANLECHIAAYRAFAQTIKLKNAKLLEAYISAIRGVAADTDARRLTKWQKDAVYEGLSRSFSSAYLNAADSYLAKFYRAVAKRYLLGFDNAYIAARNTESDDEGAPPWDLDAVTEAQRTYDQSTRSCYERRVELKTNLAYWECRAVAEKALAVSVHRRDVPVLESLLATTSQAATDADNGKISADQLKGVIAALTVAYYRINENAWHAWHIRQQKRGASQ